MQLQEYAGQLLAGNMKERGIGENAIKAVIRKIEREEVLLPYFEALCARHCGEARGTVQADGRVTELDKRLEIAPRPAAEVEDYGGRFALDLLYERRNVLADVVSERAFPKFLGVIVIVLQR